MDRLRLAAGVVAALVFTAAAKSSAPPPPPPQPPLAPMRVGGPIAQPRKVKDVKPIYPPEAQAARVQGVVVATAKEKTR